MLEEKEDDSCRCDCSILPKCPKCKIGYLLPFSFQEDVFEKWKCSNPECNFVVRKHD